MARRKRTKTEREADLALIAEMRKRCVPYRRIAEHLTSIRSYSLTHVTIKRDVDTVLKRWRDKQSEYIENFIATQLQQIQEMKREAWAEYARSKTPLKYMTERRKMISVEGVNTKKDAELLMGFVSEELSNLLDEVEVKPEPKEVNSLDDVLVEFRDLKDLSGAIEIEQNVKVVERLGNPKYLDLVSKLLDQEAKLLGFYKDDTPDKTHTSVVVVTMPAPSLEHRVPIPVTHINKQHED